VNVLDLFSGIGGFSFGLERTGGFQTIAFCDSDPFARRILDKHWPGVPVFDDVRRLGLADLLGRDIPIPDVVCGGFPCQDISFAGKGAGLEGGRSGLWFEMLRIIAETRPRWAILENVAALRSRGLDTVLGGIASIGYDAEWHCIPASAIGAPHQRDRVWVVAYPPGERRGEGGQARERTPERAGGGGAAQAYTHPEGGGRRVDGYERGADGETSADVRSYVPDPHGGTSRGDGRGFLKEERSPQSEPDAVRSRHVCRKGGRVSPDAGDRGATESRLGRIVDGLPHGVHSAWHPGWESGVPRTVAGPAAHVDRRSRLIRLGNSVVPQIPELIGRAILESML
jgi:DNA (cytosine-5)-methyltransferase 1